jgi:phosphatidylinositol alpha-1,6-mannosyltransferase
MQVPSTKQVRALLCLTSLDPSQAGGGGIASVNRNVVRALQRMAADGRQIHTRALVYHGAAPGLRPEYTQEARSFQAEGCNSKRLRFVSRFLWHCIWWRPTFAFVAHLHLAVVPYLFGWLLPRGYVLFCHRDEFDGHLSQLRRAAFRGATLRLSNSHFTARRLTAMFPGVTVEPCELAMDELAIPLIAHNVPALPDAFGVSRPLGDNVVLICSHLRSNARWKGHDQLIAVMPRVVERVPSAQLVIAGDGDDWERLQQLARKSGAGHAILFSGFAAPEMLAGLYARCRLFTMPSRNEGFGLVYVEAMRFGKPCIASRDDGGADVVSDGVSGLLVNPDDLGELRSAVERLLCDDRLAQRMGKAGLERFQERYRFDHFLSRFRERLAAVLPELRMVDLPREAPAPVPPDAPGKEDSSVLGS